MSVAMLLRHSLGLDAEADAVEEAVGACHCGWRAHAGYRRHGRKGLSTREIGDAILARCAKPAALARAARCRAPSCALAGRSTRRAGTSSRGGALQARRQIRAQVFQRLDPH